MSPRFPARDFRMIRARTAVATIASVRSNPSTCLPVSSILENAPDLGVAYSVAAAAERARSDKAPGYRLYFLAQGRFGSCDVPTEPHAFIVVGRHEFCDLVLDADPTIALRHLLVRARRLDDGALRLSMLDLHTNLGFEVSSGESSRSISATGPLAFRVGRYALVAIPGGDELPTELPKPAYARALIAPKHPYRDAPVSSVTLLPSAMDLGASHDVDAKYTVMLWGARGSASVRLSELDLELGVLVGRAPKCNAALASVLNNGISRVHLLLRRGVAYDLASTQGTYSFATRIRSFPLESGTELRMGTVSAVFMRVAQ